MERLLIEGGRPLRGVVPVEGAKNAALPLLAATLLVDGPTRLFGVPDLDDVHTMLALLTNIGAKVERQGDQVLDDAGGLLRPEPPDHLVTRMRASFLVMGPLL